MTATTLMPLGDTAITITLGEGISEELSALVVACAESVQSAGIIGVRDVVPSYAALGVHYDPLVIGYADLRDRLVPLLEQSQASTSQSESALHVIPVRYDGEDLAEVAHRTGLSEAEVMRIHSERDYRVYVVGFVPGFAYLGTLDERLVLPRRASPRKRVPPGAVAIADSQTGIYPSATPGGWHLIGTTPVTLFDPQRSQPSLFRVGDRVRFQP